MHTEKREDPLVELGYEVRDLNTVAIRNATIGFFIFAIGSAVIGFGVYRVMNPTVFDTKPSLDNRVVPGAPNPLIQSNMAAKTDIMDVRQAETAVLTGPISWSDASKTHVRLPIEKAMQIIAAKGVKPTGFSVPAVSKGHTPNPAIGEKPNTTTPQVLTVDPSKLGGSSKTGTVTLQSAAPVTGIQVPLTPSAPPKQKPAPKKN